MVVSSSKGAILPTTLAQLATDNGYRTANSGTAWSFFPFVADYFDFKEYYSTGNFETMLSYLSQKNSNGSSKYYVIASCGAGIFTSGGHYIVLVADTNGTITIYDPYLYHGKFNTASRRNAGVVVSGNSVYVSESSFKKYANYKNFWIFSNDGQSSASTNIGNKTQNVTYARYVATKSSNLNVRNSANLSASKIGSLPKGTQVTVMQVKGDWSKISSPTIGWVSTQYLSASKVTTSTTTRKTISSYKTGTYKVNTNIHVRTGPGTNYSYKTYKQLTTNARSQNKKCGNYYYNGYKKGVICTVTRIKGNWGKTASGWICLDYCKKY